MKFFTFVALLAFLLTTSGFTLHTHSCTHHEIQFSINEIDDCCAAEVVPVESSCCEVVTQCAPENEESGCCESDQSYYKLSDLYVAADQQKIAQDCCQKIIEVEDQKIAEPLEESQHSPDFNTHKKKPDRKKYRLYQRAKLDPPLI